VRCGGNKKEEGEEIYIPPSFLAIFTSGQAVVVLMNLARY
jgi:hypothetical protein